MAEVVIHSPAPCEIEDFLERRRHLGLDLFDEVWEGVLHVVPGPAGRHAALDQQVAELLGPPARAAGLEVWGPTNIGDADDYRVPDRSVHRRPDPDAVFHATAALVVEIVSPGDTSWRKLDFYAGAGVEELVIVDPQERTVTWMASAGDSWQPARTSTVLGIEVATLVDGIRWP